MNDGGQTLSDSGGGSYRQTIDNADKCLKDEKLQSMAKREQHVDFPFARRSATDIDFDNVRGDT